MNPWQRFKERTIHNLLLLKVGILLMVLPDLVKLFRILYQLLTGHR